MQAEVDGGIGASSSSSRPGATCAPWSGSALEGSKLENYLSARGAEAYRADHTRKLHRRYSDWRELRIYRAFFDVIGGVDSVLDVPCGYGRLFVFLAERARRVHQADLSGTMLALNARTHGGAAASYFRCSGLEVPAHDRAFDVVLSVRLNHHLVTEQAREAHIREVLRVAGRAAIVSFFSSTSLKNRLRQLRARWGGKTPKKTLHPSRVAALARAGGFRTARMVPLSRIGSGHVLALLVRDG